MANVFAVHAVGASLAAYLIGAYPQTLRTEYPCVFNVLSTGELDSLEPQDLGTTVSLILYSVTINEHFRSRPVEGRPGDASVPLSLDLHFLLTAWADDALTEHTVLTWAMLQLHQHPFLRAADLSPEAAWRPGDLLHVLPEELSMESLMTVWDALAPSYRLSAPYVVRVVRIDAEPVPDGPPVVATRFDYVRHEGVPE